MVIVPYMDAMGLESFWGLVWFNSTRMLSCWCLLLLVKVLVTKNKRQELFGVFVAVWGHRGFFVWNHSLPETNSLRLKMDGWKMILASWDVRFRESSSDGFKILYLDSPRVVLGLFLEVKGHKFHTRQEDSGMYHVSHIFTPKFGEDSEFGSYFSEKVPEKIPTERLVHLKIPRKEKEKHPPKAQISWGSKC